MRYLAVDLGQKRTGLAVGDDQTGVACPAGVLELPDEAQLLAALLRAIDEHRPEAIVIGLPVNMDGSEGPPAARVRAFGRRLAEAAGLPVHLQDERLSSFAADQRLAGTERTRRQRRKARDALAAAEILGDFLMSPPAGPVIMPPDE